MKPIIVSIISILIVIFGAYVAGWVMFVGGIVDVIDQIRAEEMESIKIAVGIARIVFCGFTFAVFVAIANITLEFK